MAIATTLKSYLEDHHVEYDMVEDSHSSTALESAHAAPSPFHYAFYWLHSPEC
jgi:deoxyxylulose-5-phosphate synthase